MSVKKRPDGKWRARYRDPDGKERAAHFDLKADAERWERKQKEAVETGGWIDPALAKQTFGAYVEQWQAGQLHHRATTAKTVSSRLNVHILPAFKNRQIGGIRRSDVQAWVASMSVSPAMARSVFRVFSTVMNAAVADGVIARSPCVGVNLPKVEHDELVIPTVAQVTALAGALRPRWAGLVWLAAGSGMRRGECLGLTVDRIDFLRRTVRVDRQLQQGGELVVVKTGASVRTIPLAKVTIDMLAAHLAEVPWSDGLVFRSTAGGPVTPQRFNEAWRAACTTAEVEGLRFHDLRHFYASLLIAHGESVKVVQKRLGHARAAETLDTYGHLWPDDEDRTRGAVEAVLGTNADSSRTTGS